MNLTCSDGGSLEADPWKTTVTNFATIRQINPTWPMLFLRGIGCNWLVCLGCFFAMQGRDLVSKVAALYIPIFTFVALGFDHVVGSTRRDESNVNENRSPTCSSFPCQYG